MALAVACLTAWAINGVSTADAQTPGDSVTGILAVTEQQCFVTPPDPPFPGSTRCIAPNRYLFDVHSGPNGEAASGTVDFVVGERQSTFFEFGSVSCLAVTGNRASIGVDFADFPGGPPVRSALLYVEDLGGEGQDKIAIQDLAPGVSAPSVCPAVRPPQIPLQPTFLVRGAFGEPSDGSYDIVVTDTVSRPTTKDQCKNGGWKSYGVFKNQGDCVSYVATKGKNRPSGS
jgi:hypothetical protein